LLVEGAVGKEESMIRIVLLGLAIAAIVAGIGWSLLSDAQWSAITAEMMASMAAGCLLLAWFIPHAVRDYSGKSKQALRDIGIWAGVFSLLVVGYAYRSELIPLKDRIAGALLPGSAIDEGNGRIVVSKNNDDSHFTVDGFANGKSIRFMLDTGASDVVLTQEAAQRLGLTVGDQDFTRTVSTANGETRVAPIRLDELRVASIVLTDVKASVAKAGELDVNLLGMSFLSRLSGYSVEGDRLTLRQ
jgi:aspartyl protease family protein